MREEGGLLGPYLGGVTAGGGEGTSGGGQATHDCGPQRVHLLRPGEQAPLPNEHAVPPRHRAIT